VDAVASMLYRDYSRAAGEWIPNEVGGNENLGAVSFLQELNRSLYGAHPDIQTIAEESTAWPGVTRPVDADGLGFGYKWDMGWMHDTLQYLQRDPVHRGFHHNEVTFRPVYAGSENYVLPLSHDEVVHGKGSLLSKMPGDPWQQRAGLRLLLGYQWATPGKKLLFMGAELGQWSEWRHESELDWGLGADPDHAPLQAYVAALNEAYRSTPALHAGDCDAAAFEWVVGDDATNSMLAFLRWGPKDPALVVVNFTPVPRHGYRLGVPRQGRWRPLLQSDDTAFGGSGVVMGSVETDTVNSHGQPQSLALDIGPLGVAVFVPDQQADSEGMN
jgi:1,4-alpha-glucan branching enzyme